MQIGRTHEMYKSLVELLAESNKISGHVSFRYLNLPGMSHSQVVWDIVVCDIVNPQGELRSGILEELAYIRLKKKIKKESKQYIYIYIIIIKILRSDFTPHQMSTFTGRLRFIPVVSSFQVTSQSMLLSFPLHLSEPTARYWALCLR